ncbi:bifunctional demethylmenaquinone methyltransferase/2-methoxy-6-polyprenyl-1,4-benzoquinol methylase UbiE [Neorickettsia sennetsu]|uniref:Ubiquinone/menaquinone biosynthesis C-methyltransferase UbiE n=1 Tax=Ehrlichia sennetsu (strain ATCC VR-367 / Miyayama) TaxID=222891 RepID=Q2GCI2_EHRS3|nr:bifunctional demethylmenaquinone methyltransferase/2-methoxy-6-polyprenyl-1,4-benzoquinol methylase UbiE [Neorickettsia sennetsu]ABD46145.1 ubiquinone/menaquinone biosynthesis methlytransferase UbiE [Neorickettsia sennetsu str. Miyayama]
MEKDFVNEIFSSVSQKYDLMNDIMSGGIHRLWKRNLVKSIGLLPNQRVLDMAAGTGDITLRLLKTHIPVEIILCDKNHEMLEIAKDRLLDEGYVNLKVVSADAAQLPFEDCSFDHYVVAFGVRNFSNIERSLTEAYRVLKPGGRFSCLEFSKVKNKCMNSLYNLYSHTFIPWVGEKITKNRQAYTYLIESIQDFPDAETFCEIIRSAGFGRTKYRRETFGVAAIHTATKL